MSTMELRPDAMGPDELDAVQGLLADTAAELDQTPRLTGPDGRSIELPHELHEMLVAIVEHLRAGNGISVIPMHAELTTVEAAEILNMSRPHLVKLLKAGEIPHHMVGTHRRLRLSDVLAYRDELDARADEALAAMTDATEAAGLYR